MSLFIERVITFFMFFVLFLVLRKRWNGPIKYLTIMSIISTIIYFLMVIPYFQYIDGSWVFVEFPEYVLIPHTSIYLYDTLLYLFIIVWTICLFLFSVDLRKRKSLTGLDKKEFTKLIKGGYKK